MFGPFGLREGVVADRRASSGTNRDCRRPVTDWPSASKAPIEFFGLLDRRLTLLLHHSEYGFPDSVRGAATLVPSDAGL
jgi:hypothetical protein